MKIYLLSICFLLFSFSSAKSQILISMIFGDKLNSEKLEFGLDGGVNFASLNGVSPSNYSPRFNLGFYFDIKLKEKWFLHTGVIVKSNMGAQDINPYLLNDTTLNGLFATGEVKRNLQYFNVPILLKRKFSNNFYAEAGIQLGLLNKAYDEFSNSVIDNQDLNYKISIRKEYNPLDAGVIAGVGYRLLQGNGINIGLKYYYGLVDIVKDDNSKDVFNQSFYLTVGIPIGAAKTTP